MRAIDVALGRLEGVRQTGAGQWVARCPAHSDRSPSLSIADKGNRLLMHCFAGCEPAEVAAAIGLRLSDLFDAPLEPRAHDAPWHAGYRGARMAREMWRELVVCECARSQREAGRPLSPGDVEREAQAVRRLRAFAERHGENAIRELPYVEWWR